MKNLSLILFVSIFSFIAVSNSYSQTSTTGEEIVFVFDNEEVITNNFVDKTNNKIIDFEIRGLSNKADIASLIAKVSNYRGVLGFTIGDKLPNNDYSARIELYNYANYWMYYKFLFIKNGVNKVIFDKKTIMSESLSDK